jgi:hypothetical protein
VFVWNGDGTGKVAHTGTVNTGDAGAVKIDVPAGGFVALTTVSGLQLP